MTKKTNDDQAPRPQVERGTGYLASASPTAPTSSRTETLRRWAAEIVLQVRRGVWHTTEVEQVLHEINRSAAPELLAALKDVERHCPCGARPESPTTHPHVGGCPIGDAIANTEGR